MLQHAKDQNTENLGGEKDKMEGGLEFVTKHEMEAGILNDLIKFKKATTAF